MEPENSSPFFFKCRMKPAGKALSSSDDGKEQGASATLSASGEERAGGNGNVNHKKSQRSWSSKSVSGST
ncbi:MAG: hypothetical protein HGA97_05005 [Chlorobiaceae bacterium]|nr:hypothetical protein [Chlorobiaceae bacterium]